MSKSVKVFSVEINGNMITHNWDLRPFKESSDVELLYMVVGLLEKMKSKLLERIDLIDEGEDFEDDEDFDDECGNDFSDNNSNWDLF